MSAALTLPGQRKIGRIRIYTGHCVELDHTMWLLKVRGRWTRRIDRHGETIDVKHEKQAALWANLGDELVVCHGDVTVDRVAAVQVIGVDAMSGELTVKALDHDVVPTGKVHVMAVRR